MAWTLDTLKHCTLDLVHTHDNRKIVSTQVPQDIRPPPLTNSQMQPCKVLVLFNVSGRDPTWNN